MKEALEIIVQSPALESRWLNTVSMLEYIGARKIGKTFSKMHPPLEILEHHADETRHAFAFKKLSTMVAGKDHENYLCADAGVAYFQTLDKEISDWVARLTGKEDPYQSYLFVTTIIERRAMKLYPLYRKLTRNGFVRDEVKKIIEEEANHKKSIEDKAFRILDRYDIPDFQDCESIEERLFLTFSETIHYDVLKGN